MPNPTPKIYTEVAHILTTIMQSKVGPNPTTIISEKCYNPTTKIQTKVVQNTTTIIKPKVGQISTTMIQFDAGYNLC